MLPPRDDLHFWLYDWLNADTLAAMPAFAHVDRETGVAMIDAALDLAGSHFLPHAAASDQNPPQIVGERIDTGIALFRRLAQRLHDDGVEVTRIAPLKRGGCTLCTSTY
jgi:hypothetical protein